MYKNEQEWGEAVLRFERNQSLTTVDGRPLRPKLPCDTNLSLNKTTNQQRKIISFIVNNGPSTAVDIAKKLHMKRCAVSTHLSNLSTQSKPLVNKMFAINVPVTRKQKNGNRTKQLWVYGIPASVKKIV